MPVAAMEHTTEGAKAFVAFVVAELNYSQASLASSRLRTLFSEGCTGCRAALAYLATVRAKHGHFEGGVISADSVKARPLAADPLKLIRVDFVYRATRQVVHLGTGRVEIYDAGSAHNHWILSPTTRGWLVTDWTVGS